MMYYLVESTMIENATFINKSFLSKTNVKTERIRSTKWTYYKERGFARNYSVNY